MTHTLTLSALALCTALTAAHAAPGYRTETLPVDHRDVSLDLHIWYPASGATEATSIGKNAVFRGTSVMRSAEMASGPHPLVVLSHGSGGNAANLSWIASELAERGMIVMAPNHPGTTSRDSYPEQTVKIWERPADISAVIDFATQNFEIDGIGAMGFSLGGYTTLSVSGAQVIRQDFIDYCDGNPTLWDCAWYSNAGIDFTQVDQVRYEQSNRDPRIEAAVAVDPALAQAYDHSGLASLDVAIQLINLGGADHIPPAVNGAQLAASLTNAEHHYIQDATHFSFLGECTVMGKVIIMAAGEDAICSEVGNRSRADIHTELKGLIGDFFEAQLTD